jgi:hypothetical protein
MLMPVRTCATAIVLVLALALAACGGDDSGDETAAAAPSAAAEAPTEAPTAASEDDAEEPGEAGDTLALGDRAVVDYIEYGTSEDKNKNVQLGVSVVKVRKGSIGDFKDFNLEADQKASVPYYVDAKFENLGDVALTRHLLEPTVEDADGQEYRAINLIVLSGTFKPCPEYSEKKLAPGERFTGCSAILMPKGKELERVRFQGDVTKDPVFWPPA